MVCRVLITALLVATLAVHATARINAGQDKDKEAQQLTPVEEREAREIAQALLKRVVTGDDPKPLMSELLAAGIPEMLRREIREQETESLVINFVKPEVAAQARLEDLRAYYVAFMDFGIVFHQLDLLNKFERKRAGRRGPSDEDEKAMLARLLPKSSIEIMRGEPLLASGFLGEEPEREQASNTSPEAEEESDVTIDSVQRLRAFTSALEQITDKTRAHLKELPSWRRAAGYLPDADSAGDSTSSDEMTFEVNILEESFLGYPKGTRLICVKAQMLHVDLLNVGGRLRFVTLSPEKYVIRTPEDRKEAKALAAMFEAIESDDGAAMTALLDAGLDVNAEDDDCQMTALQQAALYGSDDAVKALLARGADVNARNEHSNDAISYAAGRGRPDIVQSLLSAGVEQEAKNRALAIASTHTAENYKEVVRLLRMYGAVE